MDENNNQTSGNGVYSYGEPTESTELEQNHTQTENTENAQDAMQEESTENAQNAVQEESTENAQNTTETEGTENAQSTAQTESTDGQENKFAYQDNHYEYNQQYNQNNAGNNQGMDNTPMDLKDWVLTLIVLMVPCVGIVMYFVWAFGNKGNINRRNFCRAQLIIFAVLLVIYLIFFALFGAFAITGAALY